MDPNDPALEFYRGDGVERFLKRYPVDDEEKRIIYRAIRRAKRRKIDEEAASDRPSMGSEKSREGEGQRAKSLREGSPKAAALRHVSAANAGTSPIGGEDLIRERKSGLPASVTDVSDRSVNKVIRVPIHFVVDAKNSGEYAFCRWNEGESRYCYTPAAAKRLLTESECRKAPSVLKAVEYKVASPSIVREMKRLGSVEISRERMRCRFDLYTDRYDR